MSTWKDFHCIEPDEQDYIHLHTLNAVGHDKGIGDLTIFDYIFRKAFNSRKPLGTAVLLNSLSHLFAAMKAYYEPPDSHVIGIYLKNKVQLISSRLTDALIYDSNQETGVMEGYPIISNYIEVLIRRYSTAYTFAS